jgi:ABC-type dipeptide/oligopeptide/nickel transport system permease component
MTSKEQALGCVLGIGGLMFAVATMAASYFIKGFVLSELWSMFIVPYFAMPEISYGLAIGILFVINLLFSKTEVYRPKEYEVQVFSILLHTFINPFVILGLAHMTKWYFNL